MLVLPLMATESLPSAERCETLPHCSGQRAHKSYQQLLDEVLAKHNINNSLVDAAERNEYPVVVRLLELPRKSGPTIYGIGIAYMAALLNEHHRIAELINIRGNAAELLNHNDDVAELFVRSAVIFCDYRTMGLLPRCWVRRFPNVLSLMLSFATEIGNINAVRFLIHTYQVMYCFSDNSVLEALYTAEVTNRPEITNILLDGNHGEARLRNAMRGAILSNNQYEPDWLLSLQAVQPVLQHAVNSAFVTAGNNYRLAIMRSLMNRPEGQRPNQNAINRCFRNVKHRGVAEWLLQLPEGQQPDREAIIDAYRNAVARRRTTIIEFIEQLLTNDEREWIRRRVRGDQERADMRRLYFGALPEGRGARTPEGRAFDIHRYSDTEVTITSANADCADTETEVVEVVHAPRRTRLIDAVKSNVAKRLSDKPLILYDTAMQIVLDGIGNDIPEERQAQAITAVTSRLRSDTTYHHQLRLAVTFMQTYHPEHFGRWIVGFVDESATAYDSRRNTTSCSKGIDERLWTAMRGIDQPLDACFAQVEGPRLITAWLRTWNLHDELDNAKCKRLAQQLQEVGVNDSSTAEDAGYAFLGIAHWQLENHGLQGHKDLTTSIEVYAWDMVEPHYDRVLRPHV